MTTFLRPRIVTTLLICGIFIGLDYVVVVATAAAGMHVRKCCPWGEILENYKCREDNSSLSTWNEAGNLTTSECRGGTFVDSVGNQSTGENFCFEFISERKEIGKVLCSDGKSEFHEKLTFFDHATSAVRAMSAVFLCATLVVYMIIRELRNVQGKCLMCYMICLIVRDIGLFYIYYFQHYEGVLMMMTVSAMHLCALASLFWLNTLCFDLWWNIGDYRTSPTKQNDLKKLLLYCSYAWGVPVLLILLTHAMRFLRFPKYILQPQRGTRICGYTDGLNLFWCCYVFCPILLVANLVMFVSTMRKLNSHHKLTKVLQRDRAAQRNADRKRFYLYLKLYVGMGANWATYLVLNLIVYNVKATGIENLGFFTRIVAASQGAIIFIVFVCKRRVLVLLAKNVRSSVHRQTPTSVNTPMSHLSNTLRGSSEN